MKKNLFFISMIFLNLYAVGQNNSFYSLQVKDIDGSTINLSSFQGKKILFCTIPLNGSNSSIDDLDSLIRANGLKIKVIGIPSIEDGFSDSMKVSVKNIYQSRGINILLTEGMYTKKTSGSNQSSLIMWLTKKDLNGSFNLEVKGNGQKFFIDKNGKLFATVNPEVSYLSPLIRNYINIQF